MQFIHQWLEFVGNDYGWPVDFDWNTPDAWLLFQINDSDIPRPDGANPRVPAERTSRSNISNGDQVRITATASDDVDLASIDSIVDVIIQKSCGLNGGNDRSAVCSLKQICSLGTHTYYTRAVDHRGRHASTPLSRLEEFQAVLSHDPVKVAMFLILLQDSG